MPADHVAVVKQVLHGDKDHDRAATGDVDNSPPAVTHQRADPGKRDQGEDDDEPPVVRTFESVE
jgi:hypothetical protein